MSVDEHLYQNKALNSKFVLLYKYAVILETVVPEPCFWSQLVPHDLLI